MGLGMGHYQDELSTSGGIAIGKLEGGLAFVVFWDFIVLSDHIYYLFPPPREKQSTCADDPWSNT